MLLLWVGYKNFLVLQSRERGDGPSVPLLCQWQWCNQDLSTGGGGGGGVGGGIPPPTVRKIFKNSCMKTAFSCTLNAIIRGSLCSGIDKFPPLFLFLLNLSQGNIFFFFFLFYFLFFFFLFSFFFSFLIPPFLLFCFVLVICPSGGQWGSLPPAPFTTLLDYPDFQKVPTVGYPLPHPPPRCPIDQYIT